MDISKTIRSLRSREIELTLPALPDSRYIQVQNSNSSFSNMSVTLTDEQFQSLINRLSVNNSAVVSTGNFSKCSSRFDGAKDSDVNAFLDAVEIFKDCTNVSDNNALKGLPMLLDGFAATWFHGVKSTVPSWKDAIDLFRITFGPRKPPYKVYRELFKEVQELEVKTDIFICKCRSILAQLPNGTLNENTQMDMVYGLLHAKVREKVPRDAVTSFNELLSKARIAEESFNFEDIFETSGELNESKNDIKRKLRPRCAFCKNIGHTKDECRKLANKQQKSFENKTVVEKSSTPTTASQASTSTSVNSGLVCYGCKRPGFIRSNCPTCKNASSSSSSIEFSSAEICSNNKSNTVELLPRSRPLLKVNILGFNGVGIIDTAAKQSIAGPSLFKIFKQTNQTFSSKSVVMKLADGSTRTENILLAKVDVSLQGRSIPTTFVIIPDAENCTLLGIDFIIDSKIHLNISDGNWNFADDVVRYPLDFEVESTSRDLQVTSFETLRSEEGQMLTPEQRSRLSTCLEKNSDVFEKTGDPTPYAEHTINTGDHTPISLPPYRMSPARKQQLKEELDKLLEEKIIEETESPWAAPVVLVPKKGGGIRLCIDYQRLNAITVPDSYPLPRIDDLLHAAKHTPFMSTIDLRSGYHQIKVKESDRDKTAFTTPFGTFRYLRMPFGLRNGPATFQRLIDQFRRGVSNILVLAYLDDLIVLSPTFDQHLEDLTVIFTRLRQFKLRANREKCVFVCVSVRYLGHLLTPNGLSVDPEKTAAIANLPPPRNVKGVQSFLQACSWFRRFILNFAEISRPLSELTRKNVAWTWTDRHQKSFETLKRSLTTAPILQQADESKPFSIRTDASSYALGAVLVQGEGAEEHPVEYASRLLSKSEQNYSTTEREALAVVWALEKFRGYIEGSHVTLSTDHQPLRWLLSLKSPTGRLARWALQIQGYDLQIEYLCGKRNVLADFLSRPPCCHDDTPNCDVCTVAIELPRRSAADIRTEQLKDPDIAKIINSFENPKDNTITQWTNRGYIMTGGVLYKYSWDDEECEEAQLVVPIHERSRIMQEYHDDPTAAHYGVERTYARVAKKYYFTGMKRYITEYIKNCPDCQRYKASNQKPAGLLSTPIYAQRFETLAIDLFGPLPESDDGKRWIFIVEDTSTKWVELFALETATSERCAKLLIDEVFLRYGLPRKLISDNGVQFISEVMQLVCLILNVKQSLIPVYHPEANMVERKNRDLKPRLAMLVKDEHTSWPRMLATIRFAMNTAKCESTGYSPAYLTFGRELRTLDEVQNDLRLIVNSDNFIPQITPYLERMALTWQEARSKHDEQQDRRKKYADTKHSEASPYSEGQQVWVDTHLQSSKTKKTTKKFNPRRDGPYVITKVISSVSYQVAAPDSLNEPLGTYHVSALTPYHGVEGQNPIQKKRQRGRPRKTKPKHTPSCPSSGRNQNTRGGL